VNQKYRLKSSSEIRNLKQAGVSLTNPLLVLVILPNQKDQTKIAVIASRSVGNAVQRNRCKRLLRASISIHLDEIASGYNILLIARNRLLEAKFDDVCKATKTLLVKGKLLRDPGNT
jgi:ribonuclease P protein component